MKKILIAATLVSLCATSAFAVSNIAATKHNLRSSNPNGNTIHGDVADNAKGADEICIYCHTPHNASQAIPLWNRTNPSTASYTYYVTGTNLSAAAKGFSGLPATSVSLFCLSCHDGAAGAAATNVGSRVVTINTDVAGGITVDGNWGATSGLLDGANYLSNDHPVGFSYTAAVNDVVHGAGTLDFKSKATAITNGLAFFPSTYGGGITDAMECSSCHMVHDNTNGKFLRISNAGSALCLGCHTK